MYFNKFNFNSIEKNQTDKIVNYYDAKVIQDLRKAKVTITSYSDGIKSKSDHDVPLWPLIVKFNEIECDLDQKRFTIGCYYGNPDVNFFLFKFSKDLNKIYKDGVFIKKLNKRVYPALIDFQLDYQARSKFLYHGAHNGYCGCTQCLNPGESLKIVNKKTKKVSTVRIYRPNRFIKLRTVENQKSIIKDLDENTSEQIFGVKDKSILLDVEHFNPYVSMHPEPMHFMFGGKFNN